MERMRCGSWRPGSWRLWHIAPAHCLKQRRERRRHLAHLVQVKKMFTTDTKTIKARLEDLIQREYLERDENNKNLYKYLA